MSNMQRKNTMSNLKKMISRYMQFIALIIVLVTLVIAMGVQALGEQRKARESAIATFEQMEQILEENQKDLLEIKEEYSQTCLNNAEAIAYIIQYHPTVLDSADELKEIAEFMEVDEIHIFDKTGSIFTGTHPEYIDLTFDSGEQIGFFKPMLEDKSLRLCQDITPNTAEGKLMQYSALWSENGEFIVQVGMEPVNIMNITEKNELSHIFSLLRVNVGVNFCAIDIQSGEIVGSTVTDDVGKNLNEIGLDMNTIKTDDDGFHVKVNGVNSFCVFTEVDGNYIGRLISNDVLYESIPDNVVGLALCLISIAVILVFSVTGYMNRYVVDGIHNVNDKLRAITKGNLNENVDIQSSLEFSELSNYINDMIKSLLANTEKISYILNRTNMHIGVYEYNEHMKNVRFTEYIPNILALDADKTRQLSSDYKLFKEHIDKLRENPLAGEEGIFLINGDREIYVKLEEVTQDSDTFGIVIDVTEEIVKRRQVEAERDIDVLTGLYNRRGLETHLSILFREPEKLGYGALIMLDADGLKEINDKYGHEKGDVYLKKISGILKNFGLKSCMAARQGGDEFVVFLYDYDSEHELINTIKTLEYVQHNSTVSLGDNLSLPLRFSFGYSMTKGERDYDKLLKQADEKMYANKRERKKGTNM